MDVRGVFLTAALLAGTAASGRGVAVASIAFEPAPVTAAPDTGQTPALGSRLALDAATPQLAAETPAAAGVSHAAAALTGERAAILLRSLTLPGWGQATVGSKGAARAFGLAEVGIWASFTAFRVQHQLRKSNYEHTAELLAGIDLDGRDEEFRRIVGSYRSSEEYNQLVVFRDAANIYLSGEHPDPVAYRAYIAEHSLKDRDLWEWDSDESLLRYRGQRKDAQRASLRANTALAVAVVNRLLSAVHAARAAGQAHRTKTSWNLEAAPADPDDPTAYRFGVRARF